MCVNSIYVCARVCVRICVCVQKTSAPELLNQSLVTLTQMQAPSNHHLPAISGQLSGHISRVVIRSSARFQGDAGLAVRPQDLLRGPQSSSNLSPAVAAVSYTCIDRAHAQEVTLAPFSSLLSIPLYFTEQITTHSHIPVQVHVIILNSL